MADELELRVRRAVLSNAVEHDGHPQRGPVLARLLATDPSLRPRASEVGHVVDQFIDETLGLDRESQIATLERLGGAETTRTGTAPRSPGLPELPDAVEGKVVLRLAPFPNGALHIGNARMLFVNDEYRRRYRGRLLLVFDDTIGSEEKRVDPEMFDVIRHDLEIVGVPPDEVLYKSDRMPRYYEWARRVIEKEGAYVCKCPAPLLRENREAGRACPERSQPTSETAALWDSMLAGKFAEGEAVLRLRTDIADPDPAFRDRVLFRVSDVDHPRVGSRYRVWPLLEISWAVDDIELGLTHVLRGKDLVIEDRMERAIWALLGLHGPHFLHWGLLRVREAKISKSKSVQEVKAGLYDGWADPRTWSIDSLDRRGIRAEALRRFTLSFGLSLADIEVPAETLYAENRHELDPIAFRRAFASDPVRVEVSGYPEGLLHVELPNHPEKSELGVRTVRAGPSFWLPRAELVRHAGKEIRLKDLINVELPGDPFGSGGPTVARFTSRPNQRLPRIQWVSAHESAVVDMLGPDGIWIQGRGERSLLTAEPGQVLQFERVGFVRVEKSWSGREPVRVCFGHP